jgi:hypothetical protein
MIKESLCDRAFSSQSGASNAIYHRAEHIWKECFAEAFAFTVWKEICKQYMEFLRDCVDK